jgi:plasmid stabilization system protein ParE
MPYHVIVLDRAGRDAGSIVSWLHKRSPRGASRWLLAFEEAKEKLADDPLRYALAPESPRVDFDVRQIFFKTPRGRIYRALYTVIEDEVRILRVRSPDQRLLRGKDLPRI